MPNVIDDAITGALLIAALVVVGSLILKKGNPPGGPPGSPTRTNPGGPSTAANTLNDLGSFADLMEAGTIEGIYHNLTDWWNSGSSEGVPQGDTQAPDGSDAQDYSIVQGIPS